jgi:predicted pyridoxine 5'-phosphate oxidase superfamily flavin-nucleotide-binding protein
MTSVAGYHDGELAVQRRAGVTGAAARLAGMVGAGELGGGIPQFLAGRSFAAISARDGDGTLWTSPLIGGPGFLDAVGPTTLAIHYEFPQSDPLHHLAADQPVGLVVMEFAARRRVRINGTLVAGRDGTLTVDVDQAYGNCPQYIHRRRTAPGASSDSPARVGTTLTPADIAHIRRADTFFLGTSHPTHGVDTSHRGGTPGFVRVDDGGAGLWWPDYPGNNMFNSLGNLAADPVAALLFVDFTTGAALHLTGRAEVVWTEGMVPGDDGGTGRRVQFTLERFAARFTSVHSDDVEAYRDNPPLTTLEA